MRTVLQRQGLRAPWVLRILGWKSGALGKRCRQSYPRLEHCSGFCRITWKLSLRAEITRARGPLVARENLASEGVWWTSGLWWWREAGSEVRRAPSQYASSICDDSHETPQPVCSPRFKLSEGIIASGRSLVSRSGMSAAQRHVRGAARLLVTRRGWSLVVSLLEAW